jgi:hypothetical protein
MLRFEELRQILGQIRQENPNCYWLFEQIINRLRVVRPVILESWKK